LSINNQFQAVKWGLREKMKKNDSKFEKKMKRNDEIEKK
jgi:hypothetical protein